MATPVGSGRQRRSAGNTGIMIRNLDANRLTGAPESVSANRRRQKRDAGARRRSKSCRRNTAAKRAAIEHPGVVGGGIVAILVHTGDAERIAPAIQHRVGRNGRGCPYGQGGLQHKHKGCDQRSQRAPLVPKQMQLPPPARNLARRPTLGKAELSAANGAMDRNGLLKLPAGLSVLRKDGPRHRETVTGRIHSLPARHRPQQAVCAGCFTDRDRRA